MCNFASLRPEFTAEGCFKPDDKNIPGLARLADSLDNNGATIQAGSGFQARFNINVKPLQISIIAEEMSWQL